MEGAGMCLDETMDMDAEMWSRDTILSLDTCNDRLGIEYAVIEGVDVNTIF